MTANKTRMSGQRSGQISGRPLPFSMIPRTMRRKWVRGALADPLRPAGHPAERKGKSGEQDARQEKEHGHLHRLKLVLGDGREGVADGEIGDDVDGERRRQQRERADHGHVEDRPGGDRITRLCIEPIRILGAILPIMISSGVVGMASRFS